MAIEVQVDKDILKEKGVILLTISYDEELLFQADTSGLLSSKLIEEYQKNLKASTNNSCIVKIDSEVAGSPIVRALFGLWKEVVKTTGNQVICVGYPEDYLYSLTSLGLPTQKGFSLASTEKEAVEKLVGK